MIYLDRHDAGRRLAQLLPHYRGQDVIVLGLPRGGVPVAYEVAQALQAPLDVFIVRKLGLPGREELAMGAIASGGVRVLNPDVLQIYNIPDQTLESVTEMELRELERRERDYRDDRPPLDVAGKMVILIDDGLATGSTMRAAVMALRRRAPKQIAIAVPVASAATCAELGREVDEVICAATPEPFYAVGSWYEDFTQTTDAEVRELLGRVAI